MNRTRIFPAALLALLAACASPFQSKNLRETIQTLSSDDFEGRKPGTRGEEKTVPWLVEKYRALGLQPGNPDGSYIQKVPLVGIATDGATLRFGNGNQWTPLRYQEDFMSWTRRESSEIVTRHEIVFVGYGIVAPEYDWDDYKGVDVKGKILLMLVNNPHEGTKFPERAMTYYGRWTYKYDIAAEKGAAGCIIIHEEGPAGYPWAVVRNSWSGEKLNLESQGQPLCLMESWITSGIAENLFKSAGKDFAEMKRAASRADFRPVALGISASGSVSTTVRRIESHNVVAKVPGSDLADEFVIYTAHWDHLGIGPAVDGQTVYHGALDNASGTAMLLELARVFALKKPRRSILFLSVTAEEQGLLGSAYYAAHPLYPPEKTAADINMDGANVHGRTRDVLIVGYGQSSLDDLVREAAAAQGREVKPDAQPEKGFFYRSDQFSFAKAGVPALYAGSGLDVRGRPEGWGKRKSDEYTRLRYHKPQDVYDPSWDFSGCVEDLELLFQVGRRVAQSDAYPKWSEKSEFRRFREEQLKAAGVTR